MGHTFRGRPKTPERVIGLGLRKIWSWVPFGLDSSECTAQVVRKGHSGSGPRAWHYATTGYLKIDDLDDPPVHSATRRKRGLVS